MVIINMNFEDLWNEILNRAGDTFYTKTKLPFTYERVDSFDVKVNRNGNYVGYVSKGDIKFIFDNPNEYSYVYRDRMRTASYALALYRTLYKR